MNIFITGDTHGNTDWLRTYIFPTAKALAADAIIVLGDFGYWEHTSDGVVFLDDVDRAAQSSGIPLYWLHGNHDKFSLALKYYSHQRDGEGFIYCRQNVLYIPQGHSWVWHGRAFRSFGGAYSIDKGYRLRMEQKRQFDLARQEQLRAKARNRSAQSVPDQTGTLWFPEEEMTDQDMTDLLVADPYEKHYVLSHDKPLMARPGWNRKEFPLCQPNQQRLQKALKLHKPSYWFHGHLHYHYSDLVRSGPDTATKVVGLEPDRAAAESGWRHRHTWLTLQLREDGTDKVTLGEDADVDFKLLHAARELLA